MWLKCCFTSTETVGLLRTGAQYGHLDFHTAPELCGTDPNWGPGEGVGGGREGVWRLTCGRGLQSLKQVIS